MSSHRSLRILCRINWVDEDETVSRLWDGSGPYMDAEGDIWIGSGLISGLDGVDLAINGEAATLNVELSNISPELMAAVWSSFEDDEIIGSTFTLLLQPCGSEDRPIGDPEVKFTGVIDNIIFQDKATEENVTSILSVEISNRFTLRRLSHGAVLSDTDQRARSAVLNPAGTPDRLCERVPLMEDKTISWPRWN